MGASFTRGFILIPGGWRGGAQEGRDGARVDQHGDDYVQSVEIEDDTENYENKACELSNAGARFALFLFILVTKDICIGVMYPSLICHCQNFGHVTRFWQPDWFVS